MEVDSMRVVIVFDMEGTSHIGDLREALPMYREYWASGRAKLATDLAAAAQGLIDGGATELMVIDHHGAGEVDWPNAVMDRLPPGIELADGWGKRAIRDRADAMFQVGAHARGGDPSFMSHTIIPGLRLRHAGELLSESHWWAWTGDVPVLGIVGSVELGATLGSLGEVPFLGVQRSPDRATAQAVHGDPAATTAAIRAFARRTMTEARDRRVMTPSGPIRLEASVQNGASAAATMAEGGWTPVTDTEFVIEADAWRDPSDRIDSAIYAAADAAGEVYGPWFDGLDPSSEERATAFEHLADFDRHIRAWVSDPTPDWFTPEVAATRWEGMAPR
jgi:D-aminopeptidase